MFSQKPWWYEYRGGSRHGCILIWSGDPKDPDLVCTVHPSSSARHLENAQLIVKAANSTPHPFDIFMTSLRKFSPMMDEKPIG